MVYSILFFLYLSSVIASLVIAVREAQRPLLALTWIILSLLVPVISPLIYFMLSRKLIQRHISHNGVVVQTSELNSTELNLIELNSAERNTSAPEAQVLPTDFSTSIVQNSAMVLADWGTRMLKQPPRAGQVTLLKNGLAKYRLLLASLQQARRRIDIEYYIYRDDEIGHAVTQILMDKARTGVSIRLLRDGLGSRKLSKSTLEAMLTAGIEIKTVHPLSAVLSPMITHRDHNKIVTVDGETGFIGGMNIGDEYTGRSSKAGFWRDTHLQVTGTGVAYLQQVFDSVWEIGIPLRHRAELSSDRYKRSQRSHTSLHSLHFDSLQAKRPLVEAAEELAVPTDQLSVSEHAESGAAAGSVKRQNASDKQQISLPVQAWVQTIESGPDSEAEHIRDLFFLCITEARNTLDITTPYFAPDTDIITALKTARARGVKIRLVVPLKPDHKLIGWASRTFYSDLLQAGVDMYLYKKGILHTKVLIVDRETSVIGAANYDLLSFRNNYESCEVVYSQEFAKEVEEQFEADIEDSTSLTQELLEREPAWAKARNKGARLLAPLL